MPSLFERAVQKVKSYQPDLFVLSGDLIDYPLELFDDPFLQEQGRKDLTLVRELMDNLTCPVAVVYGNHDHPVLFRQVFEDVRTEQRVHRVRVLSFLDEEGPDNVPVRSGEEYLRFRATLARRDAVPQVHVQHYVVWPERNADYPHTYGEGRSLRDAIVANGNVRLVLSGHFHAGVEPTQEGNVWFATVPAFCEFPHPFWIYDLNDHDLTWSQHNLAGNHSRA
jgi:Icc protein